MVKMEDLRLYKFDGEKFSFIGEPDLSLDEWMATRTNTFARLKKSEIPFELIDLVEQFNEQTKVEIFLFRPNKEIALKFAVKLLANSKKKSRTKMLAEFSALRKLAVKSENKNSLTAAEALAFFLRIHLRDLKYHEQKRSAAPARRLGLLPRSVIAEIALDLLESCRTRNCSPSLHLTILLRELLNLDVDRGLTLHKEAKEWMAFVIASRPAVSTRDLARAIRVNASTVSRWRKSPEFKEKIELHAQNIASMKTLEVDKGSSAAAIAAMESLLAKNAGIG